jgi:DNA-binding response OmpR family regulator
MGPKILLVDDDRDITLAVRIQLEKQGYEVLTAGDGEQGLAAAIAHQPAAILLDIRMPKMDGLCTLARLREHGPTQRTPVVMLSASLIDRRRALDLGARYFLDKPCDRDDLVAALHAALAETANS